MKNKKEIVFTTKQLGLDNLRDLGLDKSTLILNKKKYKLEEEDKQRKGVMNAYE